MHLIVGLGNPGDKYRRNRHNIGFMVLDKLAARWGVSFGDAQPTSWQAEHRFAGADVILLKPRTYMNLSGQAVLDWAEANGQVVTGRIPAVDAGAEDGPADTLATDAIRPLVVCDDLNLPLGSLRLRAQGGSGGQNGLLSLIDCLAGEAFPRLRLGVAPIGAEVPPEEWPQYVLADFSAAQEEAAGELIDHACAAVECWLAEGLESAVSRFNRRIRPPDPGQD